MRTIVDGRTVFAADGLRRMPGLLGGFDYTLALSSRRRCCGYLLGSIPFGLLLTAAAGLGDIRKIGSGNIGATNVLRTGRKGLAAATLLLDGGKGAVAVLIGQHWGPDMAILAGAGAMLGHLFPVWLGFKGGKGVATAGRRAAGAGLARRPHRLRRSGCWSAVMFRYSSLAALVRLRGGARCRLVHRHAPDRGRRPVPGGAGLAAPSPEHPPPADGAGAQDRPAQRCLGLGSR